MKHSFLSMPLFCTALILIFMLLLHLDKAVACKCAVLPPQPLGGIALDYAWSPPERAEMIFEGTVETLEAKEGPLYEMYMSADLESQWGIYTVATIRVSAQYRGPKQQTVTVITGVGGGDCGVEFKPGEEYLIFAEKGPGGNLFTEICLGTDLLERDVAERRVLRGEGTTGSAPGNAASSLANPSTEGKICGKVMLSGRVAPHGTSVMVWDTRRVFLLPTMGRFAWGADEAEVASTGSYCVDGLDRGTYWVAAEADSASEQSEAHFEGFFPGGANIDEAKPVEVQNGTVTGGIDFQLRAVTLATVGVSILGPDGKPPKLEDLRVYLFNLDGNLIAQSAMSGEGARADGKATIAGIAPGHYRLVLMTETGLVEGGTREIVLDGKDLNLAVVLPEPRKH